MEVVSTWHVLIVSTLLTFTPFVLDQLPLESSAILGDRLAVGFSSFVSCISLWLGYVTSIVLFPWRASETKYPVLQILLFAINDYFTRDMIPTFFACFHALT